jgi:hypothetical protein
MNIVRQERAQSAEPATIRAAQNLQCAGLENASPETVEYMAKQFKPLEKMRALLTQYGETINAITDNVDAGKRAASRIISATSVFFQYFSVFFNVQLAHRRRQWQRHDATHATRRGRACMGTTRVGRRSARGAACTP